MLRFSQSELVLLANCISESLGYAEVFDFQTFASCHVDAAEVLGARVRALLASGPDSFISRSINSVSEGSTRSVVLMGEDACSELYTLDVGVADIELLRHCILDSLQGIEPWEFHARTGSTPDEARDLETQLSSSSLR
jgi:hypothetical protein